MDKRDGAANKTLRRIADLLGIPIADFLGTPGSTHASPDEIVELVRAFQAIRDGQARRAYIEALTAANEHRRDGSEPEDG